MSKKIAIIDPELIHIYTEYILQCVPKIDENIPDNLHHEYMSAIVLKAFDVASENFTFTVEETDEYTAQKFSYRQPTKGEILNVLFDDLGEEYYED